MMNNSAYQSKKNNGKTNGEKMMNAQQEKEKAFENIAKAVAALSVRSSNGEVDVKSTIEIISRQVKSACESLAKDEVEIAKAVTRIFDGLAKKKNKDGSTNRLSSDYVKTTVMSRLSYAPSDYASKKEAVESYLSANTGENKMLSSRKGKGGGLLRNKDQASLSSSRKTTQNGSCSPRQPTV